MQFWTRQIFNLAILTVVVLSTVSCGSKGKNIPALPHNPVNEVAATDRDSGSGVSTGAARLLLEAYRGYIDSISGNTIFWKDKTRMPFSSGKYKGVDPSKLSTREYEEYLDNCDPEMMVCPDYPYLEPVTAPAKNHDPGRARNITFLKQVYGKNEAEVRKRLKKVTWLRTNVKKVLMVNGENGAAASLQKISDELDKLPKKFMKYLNNPAGTFMWRQVAGTTRLSAHSFGIAIDINVNQSHYWRSNKPDKSGIYKFKNSIPFEIVEIFERNGWVWGGRWYHYDTMHFEYRPEVIGKG